MTCTSDISVFKSQDGMCILSSQAAKTDLQSANGTVDGDSPQNAWIWRRLCILDAGKVRKYFQSIPSLFTKALTPLHI